MKRIVRYIKVIISANIKIIYHYRGTFFVGAISSLLWLFLAVISINVLTYQATEVGGWTKYELLAVQGVYSVILGTMYMVFGENIKNLAQLVRMGNLDLIFTKPMDGQFLVSVKQIRFHHLARVLSGIALIFYSLHTLKISMNLATIVVSLILMIASMSVVYCLWFGFMTLSFWFVDLYNLWEFLQHFTGITRYPLDIVRHLRNYLFYILLPLVVVTSVPTQVLVGKFNLEMGIWSLIIAGLLFLLIRKFWQFALKYYTSASS